MQCSGIRGVSAIVQNWKACCGGKDSIVHSKHAVILGIITRPYHNDENDDDNDDGDSDKRVGG